MAAEFTTAGLALLAQQKANRAAFVIDAVRFGTNAANTITTATASDTALQDSTPVTLPIGSLTFGSDNNNWRIDVQDTRPGQAYTVTEVGIYSGSTLVIREATANTTIASKTATSSILHTYTINIASASSATVTPMLQSIIPATQADAQAGNENSRFMTALRVKQAIQTLVPAATATEIENGTGTGFWRNDTVAPGLFALLTKVTTGPVIDRSYWIEAPQGTGSPVYGFTSIGNDLYIFSSQASSGRNWVQKLDSTNIARAGSGYRNWTEIPSLRTARGGSFGSNNNPFAIVGCTYDGSNFIAVTEPGGGSNNAAGIWRIAPSNYAVTYLGRWARANRTMSAIVSAGPNLLYGVVNGRIASVNYSGSGPYTYTDLNVDNNPGVSRTMALWNQKLIWATNNSPNIFYTLDAPYASNTKADTKINLGNLQTPQCTVIGNTLWIMNSNQRVRNLYSLELSNEWFDAIDLRSNIAALT